MTDAPATTDGATTLDAELRARADRDAFAGVARITVGGEERFAGAYGLASRSWRVPATLGTRYDTASTTKLFTAVAAFQCIDAGAFSLDTGVIEYLGLEGTAISPEVTVRHLLTHTSGIGDDADEEAGESYEAIWRERPNYSVTETADFLPQCTTRAPNFAPGAGCRYNNCGYVLVGLMIERATGQAYRDVVRERVFGPAGMAESDFLRMDRVNERLAEGADPILDASGATVAWKRNIYAYPPIGSPDGGAHVTAGDLDRFMRAVIDGQLMSPSSTADFLAPQVDYRQRDDWTLRFGFGPWFHIDDAGPIVFLQKEGINAGTSSMLRHYPSRDLTVVMLSNLESGVWEPTDLAHELIMAGGFD